MTLAGVHISIVVLLGGENGTTVVIKFDRHRRKRTYSAGAFTTRGCSDNSLIQEKEKKQRAAQFWLFIEGA
jgi:hypothetical protein